MRRRVAEVVVLILLVVATAACGYASYGGPAEIPTRTRAAESGQPAKPPLMGTPLQETPSAVEGSIPGATPVPLDTLAPEAPVTEAPPFVPTLTPLGQAQPNSASA